MQINLVLGAGISGIGVAKLLLEKGEAVLIADDKLTECPPELRHYPLCLLYDKGLKLELAQLEYKRVIKAPGIPNTHPLIEKLSEQYFLYSDIEIAYEYSHHLTFAAITGSNGKTTVTTLLEYLGSPEIIAAGNIGRPLADVVLNETDKIIALELSSFQLEGIQAFKPKIATILNLSPDHLDRYPSVEKYYEAKLNVIQKMDTNDIFLRNVDDVKLTKYTQNLNTKVLEFSLGLDVDIHISKGSVFCNETKLFDIRDLQIVGQHNLANAMVAASMAYLLGIDIQQIQDRLKTFTGVEHRLEFVSKINDVTYYNDSKATNPEATLVALEAFNSNQIHLILGGYDKHIPFDLLKQQQAKCKRIYGFGDTKEKIQQTFPQALIFNSLDEVMAALEVSAGDIVLFSPACASYDQYANFEERGRHFKELTTNIV